MQLLRRPLELETNANGKSGGEQRVLTAAPQLTQLKLTVPFAGQLPPQQVVLRAKKK
jgi:hypothetical protein